MLINIHTHNYGLLNSIQSIDLFDLKIPESPFSCGIHPWDADRIQHAHLLDFIMENPNCVAIGEVGLDKVKGPDLSIQKRVFREWILLAEKYELPLVLHCVRAWNEVIVEKRHINGSQPWIYHGFSKVKLAQEVVAEGIKLSFGAALLTNEGLQNLIKEIPIESFFLETDDSDVCISVLYEKVSELKNIPLSLLEDQLEESVKRTFKKWRIGSRERNC